MSLGVIRDYASALRGYRLMLDRSVAHMRTVLSSASTQVKYHSTKHHLYRRATHLQGATAPVARSLLTVASSGPMARALRGLHAAYCDLLALGCLQDATYRQALVGDVR